MRALATVLAVCLLSTACSTREYTPTDFALPADRNTGAHAPVGRFLVQGTSTDPDSQAPDLGEYFFRGFLRGFDVDNIAILSLEDGNRVLVQPYVGEIPVAETLVLKARPQKDGTSSWGMETPKLEALAMQILGPPVSILASMGTSVFLHEKETTELLTDNEGALLICHTFVGVGVGLYSPKVVNSSKLWYRYPPYSPINPSDNPADPGNAVMPEQ